MTVLEFIDIEKANRAFVSKFTPEVLYSREYNCRKIYLYSNGNYICATEASKTLKLAKARLLARHWLSCGCTKITAEFA